MHGAWVGFVTTGDPGWPANAGDRLVMSFTADPAGRGPVPDPRGRTRKVWDGVRLKF